MKTMTLDEVKKLPPLSEAEIERVKNFKNTDFSDCPIQSKEDLAKFRPCRKSFSLLKRKLCQFAGLL